MKIHKNEVIGLLSGDQSSTHLLACQFSLTVMYILQSPLLLAVGSLNALITENIEKEALSHSQREKLIIFITLILFALSIFLFFYFHDPKNPQKVFF